MNLEVNYILVVLRCPGTSLTYKKEGSIHQIVKILSEIS